MADGKPGTVKGRSTKETRLHERRVTSYPKRDPKILLLTDTKLPRPEPRRRRGDEMPHSTMDERFFLQKPTGEYLHLSGTGTTRDKRCAFWATKPQIENLTKKDSSLAEYRRVPYRTVLGIGLANGQSSPS
jgi:hypothetical protein